MERLLKRNKIKFDKNNNTILSKTKLISLINKAVFDKPYFEISVFTSEFYILVDSNLTDIYIIEQSELSEWKNDGSFEKNDLLYKATLLEKNGT